MMHKTFILSTDQHEIICQLSKEQKGDLLEALFNYAETGEKPQLDDIVRIVFLCITKDIDRMWAKYDAISEKRRLAGRKGGAPKGNSNASKNKQNEQELDFGDNDEKEEEQERQVSDSKEESPAKEEKSEEELPKGVTIDYGKLLHYFNTKMEGQVIPAISLITSKRKQSINARCREYGKNAIFEVINKAAQSDFLNGKNDKGWRADFDWLFRPNNFPKVLEGNYDKGKDNERNQQNTANKRRGFDAVTHEAKDYEKDF